MAITTMDGLIAALPGQQRDGYKVGGTAGAAGTWYGFMTATGQPGTLTLPAVVASGGTVYTEASTNAWPFTDPVASGYLVKAQATPNVSCTMFLYDLIWGITWTAGTTGAQAVTFPTIPSRDVAGTQNGNGVEMWFMPWTTLGAAGTSLQITYSGNNLGAGQVTGALTTYVTAGRIAPFTLASGDTGVKSISSINQTGTLTSGNPTVLLMRRLATIPCPIANVAGIADFAQLGMPRVYADTNLVWVAQVTATTALTPLLSTSVVDA
jgi:hypothetical protein